jgi:hypothetical protein
MKGEKAVSVKLSSDSRALDRAVASDVVALASVRVSAAELSRLRKSPGKLGGTPLPPSRLKHTDDQTVVGLVAVLRAIETGGLDPAGFGDWGVMAASRFLGRTMFNGVFPAFLVEGAWGVSPNLVANHSLHSVSGMVSLVLKAHGPNLGVGGGPGGEIEAFLSAATLLDGGSVPGVWVVLTGAHDPANPADPPDEYEALALALATPREGWAGYKLSVRPGNVMVEAPAGQSGEDMFRDGSTLWRIERGTTLRSPSSAFQIELAVRTTHPAGERS